MFYSYFAGLGLDITVEDSTSHGRLDMAVVFNERVYLFEFKVVEMEPEGGAMAQLQERRYADKYRDLGRPIYLVGGGIQPRGAQSRGVRGGGRLKP